jgi:hypothetical protein
MIYSDELLAVAKRIFWFGTSEEALEFPLRFLTNPCLRAGPFFKWWSRWDCLSALEENRRKIAKFQSLLPLTDFSNVP